MIDHALSFAFGCFGLALLFNLWRVLRAPDVADRVLALDTMVINMIALIVLYGIHDWERPEFRGGHAVRHDRLCLDRGILQVLLRGSVIE